jgi:hypothetical protein
MILLSLAVNWVEVHFTWGNFAENERSGFNWGFNIAQRKTIKGCPGHQDSGTAI